VKTWGLENSRDGLSFKTHVQEKIIGKKNKKAQGLLSGKQEGDRKGNDMLGVRYREDGQCDPSSTKGGRCPVEESISLSLNQQRRRQKGRRIRSNSTRTALINLREKGSWYKNLGKHNTLLAERRKGNGNATARPKNPSEVSPNWPTGASSLSIAF